MRADPRATAAMCAALVDALVASGVRHVCLTPGSRSAPLAVAFDRHPRVRVWTHLDERAAAFFGLGVARALRAPVALLATSGTAIAEFLPAMVEARQGRVPLVVLSADRPPELHDAGANQTIDQQRIYGSFAKWTHELALAGDGEDVAGYAWSVAARAVAAAVSAPAGPVHLNIPLREPLLPEPDELPPIAASPDATLRAPSPAPDPDAVAAVAAELSHARRGLIVCGAQDDPGLAPSLARLARATGFPALVDPLSGARFGPHDRSLLVDRYDAVLRDGAVAPELAPDVVLRLGDAPTSRALLDHLARQRGARQVLVPGDAPWNDPTFVGRELLAGDLRLACDALADTVASSGAAETWTRRWLELDRRAREALAEWRGGLDEPFEGDAVARLAERLPDGATLVAGNSMPVRDLDSFAAGSSRAVRALANRGASGVDGVVSTALGVAAAAAAGPVALGVGDVSFVHDVGGLLAARAHGLRAAILLLNNDGGGIFSFLPVARHRERFERLFGTPHGLDLSRAADLFGLRFERAARPGELDELLDAALATEGVSIVEVRTDRERNVALHRAAWDAVARALAPVHA